jgi:hypothetical protein
MGPQGPIGLTGATGLQGDTGPQGIAGTNGSNGTNGLDGKNTIVKTSTETASANCTTGGVKLEYGIDVNSNNILEDEEINQALTKYVCNGDIGLTGPQGIQGLAGTYKAGNGITISNDTIKVNQTQIVSNQGVRLGF